jgi:Trk-type K+ transport system membrane component
MNIKEKFIGILVIILGALPFLLFIDIVDDLLTRYQITEYLIPGKTLYQIVLIVLGIWLIMHSKKERRRE